MRGLRHHPPVKVIGSLLLAIGYCLAAASQAIAADVRLAWDPSPTTNVVSYWVHYNNAATNTTGLSVNVGTNLSHTLALSAGTWSVYVTARNGQGIESDPSNLLVIDVPTPPVLRLHLQGASTVTGPWTNLASLTVPIELNAAAFYRGQLEWLR
jgi:hypothetical protein